MWFALPEEIPKGKNSVYAAMTARRHERIGIRKGPRAKILDDPQGNAWVMKTASPIKDTHRSFEDLKGLGSRLKLPAAWKGRSPILEQDLVLVSANGHARTTPDEVANTYDLAGGADRNGKP